MALEVMATVLALTGIPGINTFCKPSTMTLSPDSTPSERCVNRLPAALYVAALCFTIFINDIDVFTILIGQYRFVVDKRGFELCAAWQTQTRANSPRVNRRCELSSSARMRMVPVLGVN